MRRILIVDDHPIFAEAFAIMATRAGVDCMVDVVDTLAEAEQRILSSRGYSFVFLDFLLPEANGFSALIHLKKLRPDIPVAIISAREDAHTVSMAHAFGAAAYLGKSLSFGDMQEQVRRILGGESVFPPSARPLTDGEAFIRKKIEQLSPAQFRVLCALCKGEPNKQIAARLELAEATIKSHLASIYKVLGVLNRSQAILSAKPYLDSFEAEGGANPPEPDAK